MIERFKKNASAELSSAENVWWEVALIYDGFMQGSQNSSIKPKSS
jgi:hypothetical protein